MGPWLGHRLQLGLASVPRLARPARPERSGGLGAVGTPDGMGAAAAAPAAVGARGAADVEPDRQRVGILEQRNMDPGLAGVEHESGHSALDWRARLGYAWK